MGLIDGKSTKGGVVMSDVIIDIVDDIWVPLD